MVNFVSAEEWRSKEGYVSTSHYWQELDGFNSHHPAFVHFNLTGPDEKFQQHPNKDWKATNRTRGRWVRSKNATSVP